MKKKLLICCLLLVGATYKVVAQDGMVIMSGVVLDENKRLVPNAFVKITRRKVAQETRAGEDGIFHSLPLLPATYHVAIYVNGKTYTVKKVPFAPPNEKKVYYNFKLRAGGIAELYVDIHDPSQQMKKAGEHVPQDGN